MDCEYFPLALLGFAASVTFVALREVFSSKGQARKFLLPKQPLPQSRRANLDTANQRGSTSLQCNLLDFVGKLITPQATTDQGFYNLSAKTLDGKTLDFNSLRDNHVLITNVASK